MSLTENNVQDIRATWSILAQDAEGLTAQFYEELFRIAPEVRPLFAGADIASQGRKLAAAVGLVVRHADNLEPVIAPLHDMGARHAGYGVQDAHYDAVAQALIATMQSRLGDEFTTAARDAWVTAYTTVAGVMQAGAAEAVRMSA